MHMHIAIYRRYSLALVLNEKGFGQASFPVMLQIIIIDPV